MQQNFNILMDFLEVHGRNDISPLRPEFGDIQESACLLPCLSPVWGERMPVAFNP